MVRHTRSALRRVLEDQSQENVTIDNDNIVVPIDSNNTNETSERDRRATNIINNIERELRINNNNRRNNNNNDINNDQNANNNTNQENNNNDTITNNLTEENNNDNDNESSSSDEEASYMSHMSVIDRVQLLSDIDDTSIADSMLDYIPPQDSPDPETSQESEVRLSLFFIKLNLN